MPSALTARCTARKSTGTAVRFVTRWIAMASPYVSIAPMTVTMTNGIRSPKKRPSKDRSRPGQAALGSPNHAASASGDQSSVPNPAAIAVPTRMPIRGAQSCSAPRAWSDTITMVTNRGERHRRSGHRAGVEALRDARQQVGVAMGKTFTASSMMTVPPTVGVMRRRNRDSRAANRNCTRAEAATQGREQRQTDDGDRGGGDRDEGSGRPHVEGVPGPEGADGPGPAAWWRARSRGASRTPPTSMNCLASAAVSNDDGDQDDARQHHRDHLRGEPEG